MKNNCSDRVHVLQMDITKQEEVDKCREYVEKHMPKTGNDSVDP